jgi:hypothetical protein
MIALFVLGGLALSIIWVGLDASERDFSKCENWYWRSAFGWVVACILLWIAYFPLYLHARNNVPLKRDAGRPCPRCGEDVQKGVLDCPHCGFDFGTIGAASEAGDADQLRALARKLGLSEDDPNVLRDLRKMVQATEDRADSE